MLIRRSNHSDLPGIQAIIKDAQNYLDLLGIDQWQDGYPQSHILETDINQEESYVCELEGVLVATTVLSIRPEPSYVKIKGEWLTEGTAKYGVIHRLAIKSEFRKQGLAKAMMAWAEERLIGADINSMRIDTHKDNLGMQNLIKTFGYKYCGIVLLADSTERLAYEKILSGYN